NELVVRVADPSDDVRLFPQFPFAEIPHGKQSWYGPIGGIWQSVYVEMRHATHLAGLKITPDVAGEQADVLVALNQPAARRLTIRLTLTDPHGLTTSHYAATDAGGQSAQAALAIPSPVLWDTHSPYLYQLE